MRLRTIHLILIALAVSSPGPRGISSEDTKVPSFQHDVMAVLSKAGCNLGVCHGNKGGKGGLKLSLRGQYPSRDFLTLTRDFDGRRINLLDPGASLMLLKPTGAVAHEGGVRFERGAHLYEILRCWIDSGAPRDRTNLPSLTLLEVSPTEAVITLPKDRVRIKATARFSNGESRDVTDLAVYESSNPLCKVDEDGTARSSERLETTVVVRYLDRQVPVRLLFVPSSDSTTWNTRPAVNEIDTEVFSKLRTLGIEPSSRTSDAEFVRRVYLDLTGWIPTAEEAREFVDDTTAGKRGKLVDALLESEEFSVFWALKWSDLLRNEEKVLDRKGVQRFHGWIRRSVLENKPLDAFARELIASRGSTYVAPQANYYRAMREPFMRAESTAQLFLGTRLQCAKCHNHPFDRWTQDDYYSWASLFAGVRYKVVENLRRDKNDKHEFRGEQIVWIDQGAQLTDPRDGSVASPRFLGTERHLGSDQDRLRALAEWLTSPQNTQFARAQVNRIWYHLLGRGIVDPIDDFRLTNPASHPKLLEWLTQEFVESGFNVRYMIRKIMASETYQASSHPKPSQPREDTDFARATVTRLSAEQLLDNLTRVTGAHVKFDGYPLGTLAREIPGVRASRPRDRRDTEADKFLRLFGKPPRLLACECERSQETTLSQTFQLVSGATVDTLLRAEGNSIDRWIDEATDTAHLVEKIFWTVLTRLPTEKESSAFSAHLTTSSHRRRALEDILWSLMNSKEFLFRR